MLANMDKRKKIMIGSGAAVVLVLGLFGYLSWTSWNDLQDVEQEISDLEKRNDRDEAELQMLPRVEQEVLVLRQQVRKMAAILPDDDEVNAFVDKLTQFAERAGVRVQRLEETDAQRRLSNRRRGAQEAIERVTYKVDFLGLMPHIIQFMDQFENGYERFVRVTEFSISRTKSRATGDLEPEQVVKIPHKVEMTLETYVYTPRTKGQKIVNIRNEEQKLDKLRREGRLEGLGEDVELAVYDFQPDEDLRDPFVDPRMLRLAGLEVTEEERRAQEKTLAGLQEQLEEIRNRIAHEGQITNTVELFQYQQETDELLGDLAQEVEKRVQKKFFTAEKLAEEFQAEILSPVRHLAEARKVSRRGILAEDLRRQVDELEALLEAGNYEEVVARYGHLDEARDETIDDAALAEEFRRADTLRARAQAHLDFEQLDLKIAGAICHNTDPAKSVVIINSQSFSPGETVEPGLIVKAIDPGFVEFSFRGVRMMRRHKEASQSSGSTTSSR